MKKLVGLLVLGLLVGCGPSAQELQERADAQTRYDAAEKKFHSAEKQLERVRALLVEIDSDYDKISATGKELHKISSRSSEMTIEQREKLLYALELHGKNLDVAGDNREKLGKQEVDLLKIMLDAVTEKKAAARDLGL